MMSVFVYFVVLFAVLQPSLEQLMEAIDRDEPYVETGERLRYDRDRDYYMQRDDHYSQVNPNNVIDYLRTNLAQLKAISLAATDNYFFVSGDKYTGKIKDVLLENINKFKKLVQEQRKNISDHASDDAGENKQVVAFEKEKTIKHQTSLVEEIRKEQEKVAIWMSTLLDNLERIKAFFQAKIIDFGEYKQNHPMEVAANDLSEKAVKIYKKVRKVMQQNFKKTELLFTNNSEAAWTVFNQEMMYIQRLFDSRFENKQEFLRNFKELFLNAIPTVNKNCKALVSNLNKYIKKEKKKFEQKIKEARNYINIKTMFTEINSYRIEEGNNMPDTSAEDSGDSSDEYEERDYRQEYEPTYNK